MMRKIEITLDHDDLIQLVRAHYGDLPDTVGSVTYLNYDGEDITNISDPRFVRLNFFRIDREDR